MLQAARTLGSAEQAVAGALATHGTVPGMGHPLYETADPRATCLLELLDPLLGRRDRALIDGVIDSAAASSRARPNIDMATAALAFAMQMSADATEAMFDIARIAGWIAHAIEEYGEAPLRFRARGPLHRPARIAVLSARELACERLRPSQASRWCCCAPLRTPDADCWPCLQRGSSPALLPTPGTGRWALLAGARRAGFAAPGLTTIRTRLRVCERCDS